VTGVVLTPGAAARRSSIRLSLLGGCGEGWTGEVDGAAGGGATGGASVRGTIGAAGGAAATGGEIAGGAASGGGLIGAAGGEITGGGRVGVTRTLGSTSSEGTSMSSSGTSKSGTSIWSSAGGGGASRPAGVSAAGGNASRDGMAGVLRSPGISTGSAASGASEASASEARDASIAAVSASLCRPGAALRLAVVGGGAGGDGASASGGAGSVAVVLLTSPWISWPRPFRLARCFAMMMPSVGARYRVSAPVKLARQRRLYHRGALLEQIAQVQAGDARRGIAAANSDGHAPLQSMRA